MNGITVILYEETLDGYDAFGAPIYTEEPVEVENVLVAPTSSDDLIAEQSLYGKISVYTLGIPKGDNHDWRNKKVEFFGQTFKTFDEPVLGIDAMIPLSWNMKVKVEHYEPS